MDFPLFFLDYFGNRLLIAVVASLHVFINHPFAVGAYPLVVLLEWWGWRKGSAEWDNLAYKITRVLFIITTSVGALTGVGIWLTTALIAPFGIGSLIRVFFWGWFFEWLVFISEVILILIYYMTWKKLASGLHKKIHIGIGVTLSAFSWITMVVITAILGFMMGSGKWPETQSFLSAVFNPIYLPQLAFRTTFAMILAGLCIWFMLFFFTRKAAELRRKSVRFVAIWMLAWIPLWIAALAWYWSVVPDAMLANINVALLTQKFMHWHETLGIIMAAAAGVIVLTVLIGCVTPRFLPRVALLIPFVICVWLFGHFERVREFVRKPYVIADYMYSNGVRVSELPIFQRDGILPYATYVDNHSVTSTNAADAGRDVFMIACSRCHTTVGVNSVIDKFQDLYGDGQWDEGAMSAFISSMHNTRTYMPPFPGNEKEANALIEYMKKLRSDREPIFGGQTAWSPKPSSKDNAD